MSENKHDILPDHLVPLDDQKWALWRWVGLRSAGFSLEHLQTLASPASACAADELLDALKRKQDTTLKLCLALKQKLAEADAQEQRHQLKHAIRQLERDTFSRDDITQVCPEEELAQWVSASNMAELAHSRFEQVFQRDMASSEQALQQVAQDGSFREALLWQNRHALKTGVDVLLSRPVEHVIRSSKHRQKEALITSYIQRYCAKNDTIGFFGPVGWASIVDQGPLLRIEPGEKLLAARTVYFEEWCIAALAETFTQKEALRPWLIPRRLPFVHVEGMTLYLPLVQPQRLSPIQATVLGACDGQRTAYQLATDLLRLGVPGVRTVDDVYAVLHILLAKKRIAWRLEVPIESLYPERRLRQLLSLVGDGRLRASTLSLLAKMEAGKEAVAHAAGDVEMLEQALEQLDETFTQITQVDATRHAGMMYAGRSLVYEDCRRDLQVELGLELIQTSGPALGMLLTSARWFTFEAATAYRDIFKNIYAEMVLGTKSPVVLFSTFWLYVHEVLFDEHHPLLVSLKQKLQEKWSRILAMPLDDQQGESRIVYRTEDLQHHVEEVFFAPHPGWSAAYYHSPDVMIAAASAEALNNDEFQYVLGEIHPGANTLQSAFFAAQHPDARALLEAVKADRQEARMVLVPSKELGGATARMSNGFVLPDDWRLIFAQDSCDVPVERAVPIGALLLERRGDDLIVYTRDGRVQGEVVDVLGDLIMYQTLHSFDILPASKHTPRINFDRLVVRRETWRFEPAECLFATMKQEMERFLEVRRWRSRHSLPRYVFLKTPGERKPQYVDFDSLLSIDVMARAVRRAILNMHEEKENIIFTEMLPEASECWLQDNQQQRYTSELRLVAVDRQALAR